MLFYLLKYKNLLCYCYGFSISFALDYNLHKNLSIRCRTSSLSSSFGIQCFPGVERFFQTPVDKHKKHLLFHFLDGSPTMIHLIQTYIGILPKRVEQRLNGNKSADLTMSLGTDDRVNNRC